MLEQTNFSVSLSLLNSLPVHEFDCMKTAINQQTGDFFYDPWKIKPEYQNSVLAEILSSLPFNIGEARVIVLDAGKCYTKHADIDDRYHLNLFGDEGYLINLENNIMYRTVKDGIWYKMNAGILHTAASFGEHKRIQLVVRELLNYNQLINPVRLKIVSTGENPRYKFDNLLSPWLNSANKRKIISNFSYKDNSIDLLVEKNVLEEIKNICLGNFLYKEV